MRCSAVLLACVAFSSVTLAQASKPPGVAASSFATTEVHIATRVIGGRWYQPAVNLEGPAKIAISYGQPHARGRTIMGGVVPYDSVWRLGANLATILRTDVDMNLGGTNIPHGVYSLYALPTKQGWQLIVNREVGQWGTDYDASKDVARIPLRVKTLGEPIESLSIYLIPTLEPQGTPPGLPHGTLKIVWEKTELTTDWRVGFREK